MSSTAPYWEEGAWRGSMQEAALDLLNERSDVLAHADRKKGKLARTPAKSRIKLITLSRINHTCCLLKKY